MCVIAYKAKNVRFPSEKSVRAMWEHNPNGAGVMWRGEDGRIGFVKGFMKLNDLEGWIAKNKPFLEEVECALHFRITTHGGTSQGNCHPFVCEKGANPHLLSGVADRVLMHNGILPVQPRSQDISDTGELALRLGEYEDAAKPLETLNEALSGNRIILMDENGTHFFGDAFKPSNDKENEGILYSNLNHEKTLCSSYWGWDYGYRGHSCASSFKPSAYFDIDSGEFRDSDTKRAISLHDVDPNDLSDEDYEIWEDAYYGDTNEAWICSEYGLTKGEYRDLETEAESMGMCVEDYLEMLNEDCESFKDEERRVSA